MNRTLVCILLGACAATAHVQADQLPSLGDSSSSYVSLEDEYRLGRDWLRQLRANTQPIEDPLLEEFIENTVYKLLPFADMPQKEFEFIMIDKRELNAFAAPGGIIGVNFGLFLFSEDEDELAAVLAHELAHLGQRHYARGVEQAQQQEPVAIATLLASLLLIATNHADAGFAGLMAGQAANIQNQLAYSRDWEREADRIGIRTLAASGMDPEAMPSMFEQMQNSQRIGEAPPEFLLTHPLTGSRIADAADRAAQYPTEPRLVGIDFLVLKQEAQMRYQLNPEQAQAEYLTTLDKPGISDALKGASLCSLASLALKQNQPQKAIDWLNQVPANLQREPVVLSRLARAKAQTGQLDDAIRLLRQQQVYRPNSYVLADTLADILDNGGRSREATTVLKDLSNQRPGNPLIWKKLSIAAAHADQQVTAYQANAEYLYLTGDDARAASQLDMAIQAAAKSGDFMRQEALKERLRQITGSTDPKAPPRRS
ncbi:M48 family metalloprotease [Parathalassolituus penaei]|uniref:M48 family metalloprotease n=1 Tax=Parathalassolituus penaei TaxID=2997323 RepID=A0A9X3EBD8_9GAMM|nr:M48 family metalloprotease [Parathalassolituus penaei]MCY0963625.1 M48 family metalloprotease [Parathalassolituus penaei]